MPLSDAERQRRSRAHRSGNHELCDPSRCLRATGTPVTAPVTVTRAPERPAERQAEPLEPPSGGFGPRGTRLWVEMAAEAAKMSPPERVLLEEACRAADRLDRLDDFLTGRRDAWFRFHSVNQDGTVVRVVVDRALSEVRQQQDTLRGIVADLVKKQPAGATQAEEPKESILDELARARAARQQTAAGS